MSHKNPGSQVGSPAVEDHGKVEGKEVGRGEGENGERRGVLSHCESKQG